MVGAAGKQVLVNAQFSQEEHKSAAKAWRYKDVIVSRDKLGIVSIDGKPAVMSEENNGTQVFVTGISNVIFYKNGTVVLIQNSQFLTLMNRETCIRPDAAWTIFFQLIFYHVVCGMLGQLFKSEPEFQTFISTLMRFCERYCGAVGIVTAGRISHFTLTLTEQRKCGVGMCSQIGNLRIAS